MTFVPPSGGKQVGGLASEVSLPAPLKARRANPCKFCAPLNCPPVKIVALHEGFREVQIVTPEELIADDGEI